jgi:uncharacterized surface protein with fasciclin (FAS1) repeats
MKILSKLKIITAIIALASITFSCNEEPPKLNTAINDVDLSMMGILKGNPIFSQLVKSIEITELTETLQKAQPVTLFAPTNDAFVAFLKANSYKTINDVPKEVLKQIILNHALKGQIIEKELKTGYVKTLATSPTSGTNNISMYINNSSGIVLNGICKVTSTNITRPNDFIHVVDQVIYLPTVVTHAQANPNFTSLVDNLKKIVEPDLVAALSGAGPFTVFAPTNAAFTALDAELRGGIAGVSIPNLTKVLQYHVANGNVLASSLQEDQVVATREVPQTFKIKLVGGAKIEDASNRIINITATDVQCANGVIHVLDKVLLPKL